MYGSHKNIKRTLGTGQDHVFSIIIAIFICKNPDIKCILLVFPRSSFYKNKKHMKTFPAVIPTVHQAAVPPAHPPLPMLLHTSFREVWLPPRGHLPSPTCFSAFQPGLSSEFHDSSTQGWGVMFHSEQDWSLVVAGFLLYPAPRAAPDEEFSDFITHTDEKGVECTEPPPR